MDKHEQKYPVVHENEEDVSDPLQSSYDSMLIEGRTANDFLLLQDYNAAIGTILGLRESLSMEIQAVQLAASSTDTTAESASTNVQREHKSGGAFEAPLPTEHSVSSFSNQDFVQRFSQLTELLNKQLAGLKEIIQAKDNVTGRISGSATNLMAELGTMGPELDKFKLDPEPKS